jgi:hypothetical protein
VTETGLNPISEVIRRVVPDISEATNKFLQAAFGPRVSAWGEFQGALAEMKYAQRLAIAAKRATDGLRAAGFSARQIPERIAAHLAQEIILEDDDDLAKVYAAMLANAASGDGKPVVHPSFPKLLSQLGPKDVLVLHELFRDMTGVTSGGDGVIYVSRDTVSPDMDERDRDIAIDNLIACNLVNRRSGPLYHGNLVNGGSIVRELNEDSPIALTERGWAFIQACTMPGNR